MFVNGIAFNADDIDIMSYRRGILTRYNGVYVYKLGDASDIFLHGKVYEDYDLDSITTKDGNFAFLSMDDTILFGRDALGTKPLYYSLGDRLKIASDARALEDPKIVEPGILYQYDNMLKKIDLNPLRKIGIIDDDEEEAKETILRLLKESMKRSDKSLIGISGIDSIILAKIADKKAALVCVKDSYDHKYAQKIASKLDLDIVIIDEVIDELKMVIKILPFKDHMNISIGLIFYILARYARENGYDSIMLGQLADELFGGYARYLSINSKELNNVLYNDVMKAWRINFTRDEIVTSPFTDLILPYTSLDLVRYVLGLKPELKIRNGQRKFILRECARMLDVDDEFIREKKAVQFSSGIYKVVKKLI